MGGAGLPPPPSSAESRGAPVASGQAEAEAKRDAGKTDLEKREWRTL
jgi:hypothetical protein